MGDTVKSWFLSGGKWQEAFAPKCFFGAKLTCYHWCGLCSKNLGAFSFSSSISLPPSLCFISLISASQALFHPVSLSIGLEIKQLTMMIKVTGPIKLHMKWLSTLSQHLWQRNAHFSSMAEHITKTLFPALNSNAKKFMLGHFGWWLCVICSHYWLLSNACFTGWTLIQ